MSKIPTAEEVMQKHLDPHDCLRVSKCYEMTLDAMKEFAKMHVEAALKEASEGLDSEHCFAYSSERNFYDKQSDSILKAYPLTNIK